MRVLTVEQMRAAEAAAAAHGLGEDVLQLRAGASVARAALALNPHGRTVALIGPGNNGRDAWVAACELLAAGHSTSLYLAPRHALMDAEIAKAAELGGIVHHHDDNGSSPLSDWLSTATLAIDGLLGIGARGGPRPPLDALVAVVNTVAASRPALRVLAVDVPSGADAETGQVASVAVDADCTVVLGAVKVGLLRFPAAQRAGALWPADLGLPEDLLPAAAPTLLGRGQALRAVPARPLNSHKGTLGQVVVAAGSTAYYGAASLAGRAAGRAGAGLVAYAAAPAMQAVLAVLHPEATYLPLPHGGHEERPLAAAQRVIAALPKQGCLLVGPGLGRAAATTIFIQTLLAGRREAAPALPLVLDADGLYHLASRESLWSLLGESAVLTPHHGEMSRLTGAATEAIEQAPWEAARALAERRGVTVVLKGPHTVVAAPSGETAILVNPNPALSSGGTGDVLAGTLAGLAAQGISPLAAAVAGVYVHAMAAAETLQATASDQLQAGDLLAGLPRELAVLRRERGDRPRRDWLGPLPIDAAITAPAAE